MNARVVASMVVGVVLGLVIAPGARAQTAADPAPALDAAFTQAARDWGVPGFAVAIVKNDRVVLLKGYGVRELGQAAPVDEHTQFYTGSVTKQFTVMALALLASDGKLRIDDPVTKYLSGFAIGDECLTAGVTVRDLLAHRTGLPRADLLMFGGYDHAEILRRLRFVKPIAGLRAQFTYQNQMYLAAGEIIPAATGQRWADFIEARLLKPVGMTDGNARGFGHASGGNVASPHAVLDGAVRPFSPVPREPYGAGGVNASAADLSRWLRLLTAGGTIDGTRVVDANVIGAMTASQTVARPAIWTPGATFATYGLGWFLHDYRGHKVAQHGGNAEGWSAVVGVIPDLGLGVAVLSNLNTTLLPHALMFRAFDAYLGEPSRDWGAEWLPAERRARAALSAPPPTAPAPAPPLEPFAGAYEHAAYGTARVALESGRLVFRYGPQATGDLAFVKDDAFSVEWRDVGLRVLTGRPAVRFRRGPTGVAALVLEVGDDRIEFTRAEER